MAEPKSSQDRRSLVSELRVLWHLVAHRSQGANHQERLESFYSGQAGDYDAFRKRLLQGRERMIEAIGQTLDSPELAELAEPRTWIDIGGGTGHNVEAAGEAFRNRFDRIVVLDLTPSLLQVAQKRIDEQGWAPQVQTLHADATNFELPGDLPPVGLVTFSYSLTMIPDWFAAADRALSLLAPKGLVGVVDFYVSRKYPREGMVQHKWSTRHGWPTWFANDNVFLNPDHIPYWQNRTVQKVLEEGRAKVPYLPLVRVPYYIYVGQKVGAAV
jgi:S-adenosylmethionine-diacylgycerolhomoserine-N-methlytransferase